MKRKLTGDGQQFHLSQYRDTTSTIECKNTTHMALEIQVGPLFM
jgi:hypothetical protein